jgi:hypothetical protein
MNPNELKNWLPVLQHPKYGDDICAAIGLRIDKYDDPLSNEWVFDDGPGYDEEWLSHKGVPPCVVAALCFGVLSVLRKNRHIIPSSLFFLDDNNYSHESVLVLACHCLGIEVDA